MGVALNGKKVSGGVALNGRKLTGIAYKGDIIYYNPSVKIVTFTDGTDEEIAAMLEAHYAGKINIEDYWSVGETRKIHFNAMLKGIGANENHVAQDMTIVIIGFNHDDLANQIGQKVKSAITVQCRETLGNNGSGENGYYWGDNIKNDLDTNYSDNPRRNWLNETFINAMPNEFSKLVKTVNKKNLKNHSSDISSATIENNTKDKAFLLSYPEVFGKANWSNYISKNDVNEYEGVQYKYYETTSNIIKYVNNNGNSSIYNTPWWLRSPSTKYATDSNIDKYYYWCYVTRDGLINSTYNDTGIQLAPAFCL